MQDVVLLTRQLLACQSVTPDDAGCMDILLPRLQALGFSIEFIERHGVRNLWARRDGAPLMVFAGHTDVVPPGPLEAWTSPPFEPIEREGYLYGRGAVDMKSSIAAFICALESYLAKSVGQEQMGLALLLTSDEEGPATDGTKAVVEMLAEQGERLDYCIIGEPTSVEQLGDMIKNGRRGSLSGRLRVLGVQGHIAYPHLSRNPIHQAAPVLTEMAETIWDEGNEYFPPTSWQVSNIHAGTGASNVTPGHADIDFNFRFSTASTPDSLQKQVQDILDKHQLEYDLSWQLSAQPFLTGRGRLLDAACSAISETMGIQPEVSTTGGTSDGRFITDICPEIIELGPRNMMAHKVDEHIALEDLKNLSRIYLSLLYKLSAKHAG